MKYIYIYAIRLEHPKYPYIATPSNCQNSKKLKRATDTEQHSLKIQTTHTSPLSLSCVPIFSIRMFESDTRSEASATRSEASSTTPSVAF